MKSVEFLKVPKDRIGVLIGQNGETKDLIEKLTKTKLKIDSQSHTVVVETVDEEFDPLCLWKAKYIILAISRGFSPKNALNLLEDETLLEVIDLKKIFCSDKSQSRIKARIIGEKGKTRKIIEELSETKISIYGDTISIIGIQEPLKIAKHAIEMFIEGLPHSTVYRYLNKKKQELKLKKYELWEKIELKPDRKLD